MSGKVGVGIIGLGYWYGAFRLARALREHEAAELVGVACPDKHRLEVFVKRFPCDGYLDYGELLRREDVNVVLVSPASAEISRTVCDAARAGKHMLLAPRIAMNMRDADEAVKAVDEAGVKTVTLEAEVNFSDPRPLRIVTSGEIGQIVYIDCASHSSLAEDWFNSGCAGWFVDPSKVPGGAFLDYAVYSLQALRLFSGSRVARVDYARTANLIHKDLPVEDWGVAHLTLANGVPARVEASWTITTPSVTQPSPKANSFDRFEVVGTLGRLITGMTPYPHFCVLSPNQPYWSVSRAQVGLMTEEPPPVHPMLDHLLACIRDDTPTVADIRASRDNLEVVLAVYRSAREGRPVELG